MKIAQKKLADFLKISREQAKLSQADVAKNLGYKTAQFVSNWERGVSQPPIPVIKILAKLYAIEDHKLFDLQLQAAVELLTEDMKKKYKSKHNS